METNKAQQQEFDLARTLLILNNYDWLRQEAAAIGVDIIPIKGIDLLQTLYAERLDRPVRDIDLVCRTEDDCRKLAKHLCREEYRLEFPFSLRHEALSVKRKVSLLSCSTTKVNVDLHTAFVTKKFFSQTIGTFNEDALQRCQDGHMEPIDRWLFLAQHAAFHTFGDAKWTRDLRLLYDGFTPEQLKALSEQVDRYGFRRVMMGTLLHIYKEEPERQQALLDKLSPTWGERHFLRFIQRFDHPIANKTFAQLINSYWEFIFIARRSDRFGMWLQLMFPSRGMLTNIYRIRKPAAVLLYYPVNILVSGLTSLVFWTTYGMKSW